MNTVSPIRKIFEGVTTRGQMFRLFNRHNQRPDRWQTDAAPLYSGEWFEIDEDLYDYMLNILPPPVDAWSDLRAAGVSDGICHKRLLRAQD